MSKPGWIALLIAFTAIAGWSVYRSIQIEQQYTADLRNRVVGARLQKDHASPYFYTWLPGDAIRYYDPCNQPQPGDSLVVSNITGTPFLHHLVEPVADMPQRDISRIWLWLEWAVYAACVIMALGMAGGRPQKAMVLAAAALFLLTEAWQSHIANGQYYLLVPFLALLFYDRFRRPDNLLNAAVAGLCAIVLVLIRPNCIIFFLPFLPVIRKYPVRYIAVFFIPVVLLSGFTLSSARERSLWMDYKKVLGDNIRLHQRLDVNAPPRDVKGYYTDWEGWHQRDISRVHAEHPYTAHSENGNVFVLFSKITHTKTNLLILNSCAALSLLLLAGVFIWRQQQRSYDLRAIALFGFCLYMVADLFSPVWRHQYYTLQWLFPVLLAAAYYEPRQQKWYLLAGLALLLNILNIPVVKMEHTMGEYLLLGVLLVMSYKRQAAS
jgi:hypothetical protein